MLSRGHSIEYFIEGGRSRTGRMLNPRTGMISMTLNGYYRDHSKELSFLPVYFSYEKVMEINSYLGELAGREKNKESLFGLLTTLKLLKKDFGRVAVSFGEPLNLRSFLDVNLPLWQTTPPYDLHRNTCIDLASELSHRINGAAVLNTVNITAFAILCTQKNAIEIGRLEKQIAFLLQVSCEQLKTALLSQTPADIIENAIRITGLVQSVSAAGTTVQADPTHQIALRYYYNNVIHLFALPSLTALILRLHNNIEKQTLQEDVNRVLPFVHNELLSHNTQALTNPRVEQFLSLLEDQGLLSCDGSRLTVQPEPSQAYLGLYDLGEAVRPFLIRYYIVCTILANNQPDITDIEQAALSIYQKVFETLNMAPVETTHILPFSQFLEKLRHDYSLDSQDPDPGEDVLALQQVLAGLLPPNIIAAVTSCLDALLHKNIESATSTL
jgi:glycerol-3-phosphate O-acyltransferase